MIEQRLSKVIAVLVFVFFAIACDSGTKNVTKANGPESDRSDEQSLPAVAGSWYPDAACNFLSDKPGLQTRSYKDLAGDGEFSCSSPYKEIGEDQILTNDIAYYAYGNANWVNTLEIVLNVKNRSGSQQAQKLLSELSRNLTQKAVGSKLPDSVTSMIVQGRAGKVMVGGHPVEVTREDWPTGKGYEMHFKILPPKQ